MTYIAINNNNNNIRYILLHQNHDLRISMPLLLFKILFKIIFEDVKILKKSI
jgi:hypothetical protein